METLQLPLIITVRNFHIVKVRIIKKYQINIYLKQGHMQKTHMKHVKLILIATIML